MASVVADADTDPFEKIPPEIQLEIAGYLPTSDFYNLRLASRAMCTILDSQRFWRTRFEIRSDRGFLSYLRELQHGKKSGNKGLRLLYHCTNLTNLCAELVDRRTIWAYCRWLTDMTTITSISNSSPSSSKCKSRVDTANGDWKEVGGHLRWDPELPFPYHGRYITVDREEGIHIPPNLTKIVVSVLKEIDLTYITGIKLISDDEVLGIGYEVPGNLATKDVESLRGFEVAVGEDGIHALRPIIPSEPSSSWIGETREACITRRLVLEHKADAMNARFDVC